MPTNPYEGSHLKPTSLRVVARTGEASFDEEFEATDDTNSQDERLQNIDPHFEILSQLVLAIDRLEQGVRRIADQCESTTSDKVDTVYVAGRLGCTSIWVAEQARDGRIPRSCIVPGTGNGKPWKFFRTKINAWIDSR